MGKSFSRTRWFIIAQFATALLSPAAEAATISVETVVGQPVVRFEGPIVEGDYEQFRRAAAGLTGAKVLLDSPGGLAQEGLQIGKLVNASGFETAVARQAMCASACGFIWLAGKRKAIEEGGRVGFHAVYLSDKQQSISSSGNALVGAFLSRLGFNDLVVVYVTEAAPRDLRWLTPVDASFLGIEVAWGSPQGGKTVSPALSKDEIRQALLANEAERARLRRFPKWFEMYVDALYDAQLTGENADSIYETLIQKKAYKHYFELLRSQSSADVIVSSTRNELLLYRKLLSHDPGLCAAYSGIFPFDFKQARNAKKDPTIEELLDRRVKYIDRSLIEVPVKVEPLSRWKRARLENKLKRAYRGIKFSKSERSRMMKPDIKKDAALMCRFAIQHEEALLKDQELLIAIHRYPDLLRKAAKP